MNLHNQHHSRATIQQCLPTARSTASYACEILLHPCNCMGSVVYSPMSPKHRNEHVCIVPSLHKFCAGRLGGVLAIVSSIYESARFKIGSDQQVIIMHEALWYRHPSPLEQIHLMRAAAAYVCSFVSPGLCESTRSQPPAIPSWAAVTTTAHKAFMQGACMLLAVAIAMHQSG